MRVLVTGGAGFIGSAVCRLFVRDYGHEVLNVDALTYASSLSSLEAIANYPGYRFVQADVTDMQAIANAFADFKPDAVLHLAAESHVDRSITGSAAFVRTNVVGTHVMLEAARNYWDGLPADRKAAFRFCHISTDEVFGSLGHDGFFTEETAYDPSSPYAASKAASDHLARAWFRTYGLPVVVTNCSNNYGPNHFPEKLIPLMIINGIEGRALSVYGDGSNVRDWLYVEDHAHALAAALSRGRPGETYNVGGRNERTNLRVVQTICALLDEMRPAATPRHKLIRFVTDRPGHDHRYAIDATKIENELGWKARDSFETGIAKTVRWYLDNEAWWRPLRDRYDGGRLGILKG